MNLYSILRGIVNHPLNQDNKLKAIKRFFYWQINVRLNPYPVIYQFTDRSKLIIQKGMTGATGNLYCGLHEYTDMAFLLHFLRSSDLFVDIGANIGSYTVLSAAHVGANTISIEPVPATFINLENNILVNRLSEKVTTLNIALGSKKGMINFTTTLDTVNHVATSGETNVASVDIDLLDNVLNAHGYPSLIKIDVEGFETEVLNGATNMLLSDKLKAIIIELNGSGLRYGYDEKYIHNLLLENKFRPYNYNPKERILSEVDHFGSHNTIYVRDVDFVVERLKSAPQFKILGTII